MPSRSVEQLVNTLLLEEAASDRAAQWRETVETQRDIQSDARETHRDTQSDSETDYYWHPFY